VFVVTGFVYIGFCLTANMLAGSSGISLWPQATRYVSCMRTRWFRGETLFTLTGMYLRLRRNKEEWVDSILVDKHHYPNTK
jgi:hypothetical protein